MESGGPPMTERREHRLKRVGGETLKINETEKLKKKLKKKKKMKNYKNGNESKMNIYSAIFYCKSF